MKIFNVVDVSNFKLTDFKGDKLEILKFVSNISQDHYPERASVIAIINAPSWFSLFFRMIKPMINENTQKKIRVYTQKESYNGLLEFLEPSRIPVSDDRISGRFSAFSSPAPSTLAHSFSLIFFFPRPAPTQEEYGGTCSYRDKNGNKIPTGKGTEMEKAVFYYVDMLNSGQPLPRPPHFNREDTLDEQKDLASREEVWDGHADDPLSWSDIHLPLEEQKSNFSCKSRGLVTSDYDSIAEESAGGSSESPISISGSDDAVSADRNKDCAAEGALPRRHTTLCFDVGADSHIEGETLSAEINRGIDIQSSRACSNNGGTSEASGFFFGDSSGETTPRITRVIYEGW